MSEDLSALRTKDVICIEVDSLGVLTVPSMQEPLAEREEKVSHLRVDVNKLSIDFNRCMFRIETDAGQRPEIKFGSVVRLIHIPSELIVVASDDVDDGYLDDSEEPVKMKTIYLCRTLEGRGELAHKWIITPRYKLRNDADPLRNNDYVILKSAQYKNLAISSFPVQSEKFKDHIVGLQNCEALYERPGHKLIRLLSSKEEKHIQEGQGGGKAVDFVKGGDYVRLLHREEQGHLICRVDDEKEMLSTITPLGSVCRKRMDEKDRVHGVFVRSIAMQQPRTQYDFPVSNSSLGIWQIIPVDPFDSNRLFSRIPYGKSVRLKNLSTGQYLAIRPLSKKDSSKIKENFYKHTGKKNAENKKEENIGTGDEVNQVLRFEEQKINDSFDTNDEKEDAEGGPQAALNGGNETKYQLTIISAVTVRMKHGSWLGKRHSYLNIFHGKQFHARSDVCEGKDNAVWNFEAKQKDFTFITTYNDLLTIPIKAELMSVHNILKDSTVGRVDVVLKDAIIAQNNSVVIFQGDFNDKRDLYAGTIEFKIEVVRLDPPAWNPEHADEGKDEITNYSPPPIIKKKSKKTRRGRGETAVTSHNDDEDVYKAPGSKWVVATCQEPNRYTLFRMDALNRRDDDSGDGDYLTYNENIVLESSATSLRLNLADTERALDYEGWWEYSLDRAIKPINFLEGMIADSDVFNMQRVSLEETQDTLFASRLLSLARAATSSLQLTPSQDLLFEPLFRHFINALHTFLLWVLGQAECDGSLLPMDLSIPQLLIDSATNNRTSDSKSVESEDEESTGEDNDREGDEDRLVDIMQMNEEQFNACDDGKEPDQDGLVAMNFGSALRTTRKSSISPWIGRPIRSDDHSPYSFSYLEKYSVQCMMEFYGKNIPLNAKMIRRQFILFEANIMEQLTQFLNVYFIMQRALQLSQDPDLSNSYGGLPSYIEQCCKAILKLLHSCVYKNERNALKTISIQGMFLSLVSMRISGWDAPIEGIMEVCRDYHDNSVVSHPGQLSVEEVLIRAIHASDIRQILEQMSWMHLNDNESADNILKLLTLLCKSGKASDYFQNILANMLISCEFDSLALSSGGQSTERKCSSMLFSTSFLNGVWHVKFKPQYTIPAQEGRSLVTLTQELQREADYLKILFNVYNFSNEGKDDDDDVLDLEECFCLLEDLGYGGPFVYEEMGHLLGVNLWGFLSWWCNRASFYSLSTSVSHNQMSPYQIIQLMNKSIRASDLMSELNRVPIKRESIMDTLQFWSIISSRIPGYELFAAADDYSNPAEIRQWRSSRNLTAAISFNYAVKKPSKMVTEQTHNRDWITFDLAFSPAWPEQRWLRNSLILLDSICSGGNLLCQRIVSNLLPPEALLDILNITTLSDFDRHIICDLLVSVYVEVDFVFPTRCFPTSLGGKYCGYKESSNNAPISVGKMFNPISRIRFEGPGAQSGSYLRKILFDFLKSELTSVSLSPSKCRGRLMYTNSLLHLFFSLLSRGFFSEEEFSFNVLSNPTKNFSLFEKPVDLANNFTLASMEEFVVDKLNESLDALRESSSIQDVKDASAVAAIAADMLAKQVTTKRKTFQGFDNVLRRLNGEFGDRDYSHLIDNTISILNLIHGIKQVSRVQNIWDICIDYASEYSLESYSSNQDEFSSVVTPSHIASRLENLFKENIAEESYTKALFRGTLHTDLALRKHCFELINKQLSLPLDATLCLKSMKLIRDAHQAFLKRMLSVYVTLAQKHAEDATSSLRNYREYTIHILDFLMENIVGLVMDHFLDRLPSSINAAKVNRFAEDRDRVIHYYLTTSDLPCPPGDDDFFLLDVKKVKANEIESRSTLEKYSKNKSQEIFYNFQWTLDATEEILGLANRLISILSDRYFFLGRPGWFEMTNEDQKVFNKIMTFLATMGQGSQAICDAALVLIEDVISQFYPNSDGTVMLLHLLLSRCSDETRLEIQLINHFRERLNSLGDDERLIMKVQFYSAVLIKASNALFSKILVYVQDELLDHIRDVLITLCDDGECENAWACVQLLARSVSRKSSIPLQTQLLWQVLCPADTLNTLLTSESISLEIKTELNCIATYLYDADSMTVEKYMLNELRNMRISMYLFLDARMMSSTKMVTHYLTVGVFPALKHRILETSVVSIFMVNDYIMSEARQLESKLINKRAAQNAVDRLAKNFPTLLNLPPSKPSTSFVPLESLSCLMIALNIITFEDGYIFRQLQDQHVEAMIWLTGAMHFILITRADFVFDHAKDKSIDVIECEALIKSLREILHGLLLERMSRFTEGFFMDMFQGKCLHVAENKLVSLYDVSPSGKALMGKNERVVFKQKMNIAVAFSSHHLKNTSTYKFLKHCANNAGHFLRLGGLKIFEEYNSPQLRSKTFTSKFSQYSDFDIWLQADGKFISILLEHLGNVLCPTQIEFNLLHILCLLMDTNIEDIRSSQFLSQNLKTILVERETQSLYKTQTTLLKLGSIRTVTRVLGRLYTSEDSAYIWKYAPLLLRLGAETMSWENREAQNSFVLCSLSAVENRKPPECNCMLGLQDLIRKCSIGIMSSITANGDNEEEQQLDVLRASIQIFSFAGALCRGDNTKAQRFLSADGVSDRALLVNISEALCLLLHAILVRLTEMITYIDNGQFYDKLAPFIYAQKDSNKRRFVEWHNPRNNMYRFAQFSYAIGIAFEECISLCAQDSVSEVLQALPKTPALLEFLGVMQLKAEVSISASSFLPIKRSIVWKGGDPIHFYKTYLKEMTVSGLLKKVDPEYSEIGNCMELWEVKRGKKSGRFSSARDFAGIFGVSKNLVKEIVMKAEYTCLRLLLSCFEFAEDEQAIELLSRFNDGILIQNLNSLFQKLQSATGDEKDILTSITVAYVSLVESIGIFFKTTDELISLWDKDWEEKGFSPKSIYGSVELVGADKRLRRLYFPVPYFVKTYWPYPEVQKTKDEIVLTVNRNSPEEKISDFLIQMSKVWIVMRRQERLKILLTYPIHAILGGKSLPIIQKYFPRQRAFGLYICIGLNAYFVRTNTQPYSMPRRPSYLEYSEWNISDIVLYSVQFAHLALMATFALRTLLNSDAADDMSSFIESENKAASILGKILEVPVILLVLIWDSAWPCCLTALSFFALTGYYWLYVPCLLDIMFQFDDMNFLYGAISKNVVRVGFTCLLAFLCLYFYAIITYLFFGTQYNLNNYEGCNDPGSCFKLHLDYGLANAPEWDGNGYINPEIKVKFPYSQLFAGIIGTIYNLTYVILINLVLQAVISGLIIDTFSSMRADKEAVEQDIYDKCFVCSIGRDDFEQAGVSFQTHIKEEHNMWHYAWFQVYLKLKDPLSYSSTESFALRCMKDKQTFVRMMPVNKSLTLEKIKGRLGKDDDDDITLLLQILRRLQLSETKLNKALTVMNRTQDNILLTVQQTLQQQEDDDEED